MIQSITMNADKSPSPYSFSCPCGKTYLSYPAVYTHIKTKHNLDKNLLKNMQRPDKSTLKKGRPQQSLPKDQPLQYRILTLIECTIIKIYDQLKPEFQHIILEGNEEPNEDRQNKYFQQLCAAKKEELKGLYFSTSDKAQQFLRLINKHFTTEIATRVKLVTLLLANYQIPEKEELLTVLNLWAGNNQVNQIILETYAQWHNLRFSEQANIADTSQFIST